MPRFFVDAHSIQGQFAVLEGEAAAHAKVLRLSCGDCVTLCTGDGTDHLCTVSDLSPGRVSLVIRQQEPSSAEPQLQCTLFVAFPKADKLEHVIQKATELGAGEVVVFPARRCVSRPDSKSLPKKLERWQKIAAAAAEQSGRGRIPAVRAADSFSQALREAAAAELSVFLYENESRRSLRQAVGDGSFRTAALMTGPEGGFDPEEVAAAEAAGLLSCTLGPRILRCETAPLCALSALMFACGELD